MYNNIKFCVTHLIQVEIYPSCYAFADKVGQHRTLEGNKDYYKKIYDDTCMSKHQLNLIMSKHQLNLISI